MSQTGKLYDRIAIVTGAASGLGKAIAEGLSAEGAKVMIADIQEEKGQIVANSLKNSIFCAVDVSDPTQVEAMVKKAVNHYGKVDIVVNNAGIPSKQAPTAESSLENWRKVMSINLDGVYFGMKYGIAAMVEKGNKGVIINMGSTTGMVAFPDIAPYSAAKAGVIQLSKCAAIEYASQGIRVNAICPTVVNTPLVEEHINNSDDPEKMREAFDNFNPLPGMPTPEDVAAAAVFLASDEAKFLTGLALPVDGGYTAR